MEARLLTNTLIQHLSNRALPIVFETENGETWGLTKNRFQNPRPWNANTLIISSEHASRKLWGAAFYLMQLEW